MAKKPVNINLDISETLDRFARTYAQLNCITIDEAYTKLLNAGISSGAVDLNSAIYKGATLECEVLEQIAQINRLSKIANSPIKTAPEVEMSLKKNVEMTRREDLIAKITKDILTKE